MGIWEREAIGRSGAVSSLGLGSSVYRSAAGCREEGGREEEEW